MSNQKQTILILDNIRSAHNVGAIFRTADAIGIDKIFLIGTTPTPLDRFNRPRKDIAKTALGAEKTLSYEYAKTITPILNNLRKQNFYLIAIEQSPKSVDYKKVQAQEKTAIIVGNEVSGISEKVLEKCDVIAEIEMKGKKESLNVSVATGVALFGILK
jgi:tRNA G18 (ribose-2'-O)-methylase SpoU